MNAKRTTAKYRKTPVISNEEILSIWGRFNNLDDVESELEFWQRRCGYGRCVRHNTDACMGCDEGAVIVILERKAFEMRKAAHGGNGHT